MSLREDVELALDLIPIDFGGGCSLSKAMVMAELIVSERFRASIDIGIYRGRSYFPQAIAQKRLGGMAIGIDPFSNAEAEEHDHADSDLINEFIRSTDFEAILEEVDALRGQLGVEASSRIVRTTSHAALEHLTGKFGLIHIDGNHDTALVVQDVTDYVPLLQPGGILVMDDISWPSVKPAVDLVSARLPLVYSRVDSWNDYAVFYNGTSRRMLDRLRLRVARSGENEPRYSVRTPV